MDNSNLPNSEKKEASSIDRYSEIYHNSPISLFILDIDSNILEMNKSAYNLLEIEENYFLTKPFVRYIVNESMESYIFFLSRISDDGQKSSCEIKMRSEKGNILDVFLAGNVFKYSIDKKQLIISAIDITKVKEEMLEYNKNCSLLNSIMNSIPDLISFKDSENRFLGCNKAFSELLGIEINDLIGKNENEFFKDKEMSSYNELEKSILSEGKPQRTIELCSYPNGKQIYLDTLTSLFYNPDGNQLGTISISRDFTTHFQIEDKLRISEERLQIALDAAYLSLWDYFVETNTIVIDQRMCKILGINKDSYTLNFDDFLLLIPKNEREVVKNELKNHIDDVIPYFETEHRVLSRNDTWRWVNSRGKIIIRDDNNRPVRITGITFDISEKKLIEQIKANKFIINNYPFEFYTFIEHQIRFVARNIINSTTELIFNLPQNLPTKLFADKEKLQQILLSILRFYSAYIEAGEILVYVISNQLDNNKISLEFRIISPDSKLKVEELSNLLEKPQFQDSLIAKKYQNFELPINIVNVIAESMGSKIRYSLINQAINLFFTIQLPVDNDNPISLKEYSFSRDKKILIVDDCRTNIDFMLSVLNQYFDNIETSYNGIECLKKIESITSRSKQYDLIIIDSKMPYMDAKKVIQIIRNDLKLLNQKFLIMLSPVEYSYYKSTSNNEFEYIIEKPIIHTKLLEIIHSIIN